MTNVLEGRIGASGHSVAPLLKVENLSTSFGHGRSRVTVVHDVSFSLHSGQVLGLVGESGSGKSVTARSIMGMLRAPGSVDKGRVLLDNVDLMQLPERLMRQVRGKRIAMIFQDPQATLNPVMRVGNQIVEALTVHGTAPEAARERALELLRRVGIPDIERTFRSYPHEFSGGMRQRVVIAIALANKPDVLIADEPTTALDVTIQSQIMRLLAELRHELGIAIIMITHDMGVVAELCDDVLVMYAGRVVEQGSVREVFTRPRHPYTAALLKAVPSLDWSSPDRLPAIPGAPPIPTHLPLGCAFHPRCAFTKAQCRNELPPLLSVGPAHGSACWVAGQGQSVEPAPSDSRSVRALPPLDAQPVLKVESLRTNVVAGSRGLFGKAQPIYAVDNVSFELRAGETLGLVGESGCGKSTLSRTIMGITQATAGRIIVNGRDVNELKGPARQSAISTIQYIFQDPFASLNPRRTVGQSLEEALQVVGVAGAARQSRVKELLDWVGLSVNHLSRYPYELSGGQRQRVGIARALATNPKVLICDEPVSALDVSIQAQIINLLRDLQAALGLGYLFIAHDLSVVRHISHRIAVMYLGRIVEIGNADQVYQNPQHPYTAALLSSTPEPKLDRDDKSRIVLSGDMPSAANPPSGCRFRTRCPRGPLFNSDRTICTEASPPLRQTSGGEAACHFAGDTGAMGAGCYAPSYRDAAVAGSQSISVQVSTNANFQRGERFQ